MIELFAVLSGLGAGGLVSAVLAWYLVGTREYRRVRNPWVIGLGYLLLPTLAIGSMLLLGFVWQRSPARGLVGPGYAASLGSSFVFIFRSESRWRKSVGPDDKSALEKLRSGK